MADILAQAMVEILVDASGIEEAISGDLREAFRDFERVAGRATDRVQKDIADLEKQIKDLGDGKGLARLSKKLERLEGEFEETSREVKRLQANLGNIDKSQSFVGLINDLDKVKSEMLELDIAADLVNDAFDELARESRQAILSGPSAALNKATNDLKEFQRQVRASAGRGIFGSKIDSGLTRGPDGRFLASQAMVMEKAIKDLRQTTDRELKIMEQRFNKTFDALVDATPELGKLRAQFQIAFKGISDDARQELSEILSSLDNLGDSAGPEELRRHLALVDQALENTGESAEELFRALRLLSGADAGLGDLAGDIRRVGAAAESASDSQDNLTRSTRRAAAAAQRQSRSLNRSFTTFRLVAANARFAAAGLGGFAAFELGRFGLEATGELQQVQQGLRAYIEDIEGAGAATDRVIDNITQKARDFAAISPFGFEDVASAVRRFVAFSEAAGTAGATIEETSNNAQESVEAFSGLLSVLGQSGATLPLVAKALGDIASRGKITGEEIRQLVNALPGFNIEEQLGAQLGVTGGLESLRKFSAAEIIGALTQAAREFPGAAEAVALQAQTLSGAFETLRDSISFAFADALQPFAKNLVERINPALGETGNLLQDQLAPGLNAFAEGINNFGTIALDPIVDLLNEVGLAVGEGLSNESTQEAFTLLLGTVGDLIPPLTTLAIAAADLVIAFEPVLDLVTDFANIVGGGAEAISQFSRVLDSLPGPLQTTISLSIAASVALGRYGASANAAAAAQTRLNAAQSAGAIGSVTQGLARLGGSGAGISALQALGAGKGFSLAASALTAAARAASILAKAAPVIAGALAVADALQYGEAIDSAIRSQRRQFREQRKISDEAGDYLGVLQQTRQESERIAREQREARQDIIDASGVTDAFGQRFQQAIHGIFTPFITTSLEEAFQRASVSSALAEEIGREGDLAREIEEQLDIAFGGAGLGLLTDEEKNFLLNDLRIDLIDDGQLRDVVDILAQIDRATADVGFDLAQHAREAAGDIIDAAQAAERVLSRLTGVPGTVGGVFAQDVEDRTNLSLLTAVIKAREDLIALNEEVLKVPFGEDADIHGQQLDALNAYQTLISEVVSRFSEGGFNVPDLFELIDEQVLLPDGSKESLRRLLGDNFDEVISDALLLATQEVKEGNLEAGEFDIALAQFALGDEGFQEFINSLSDDLDPLVEKLEITEEAIRRLRAEVAREESEAVKGFQAELAALGAADSATRIAAAEGDGFGGTFAGVGDITNQTIAEFTAQAEIIRDEIAQAGIAGTSEFLENVDFHPSAQTAIESINVESLGAFAGEQFVIVGNEIANGMARGINANIAVIEGASRAAVRSAQLAAFRAGEISSPSKLMERTVGKPLAQGIASGILSELGLIGRASQSAINAAALSPSSLALSPSSGIAPSGGGGTATATQSRTVEVNSPITINAAPGQSPEAIAQQVARAIAQRVR